MPPDPLLTVEGLTKSFPMKRRVADMVHRRRPRLTALDGVSLELLPHETVGIVGESGSGKSTLARCIVRLYEPDAGRIALGDTDLLSLRGKELAAARRELQMVYQDPYSSLNPLMTVGRAVSEPATVHDVVPDGQTADDYATELLERVGLGASVAGRRPNQLSGGQRQRVAIARAMAVRPKVLIADEPVSALDVSIQAQVLGVLERLRAEQGLAMIFIAHQLPVVAHVADTVLVMYLGRVVESGPVGEVFTRPGHPYTSALLQSQPGPQRRGRKPVLKGEIPSAVEIPSGCRFRTRCPMAQDICARVDPEPVALAEGRQAWCHFADKVESPPRQLSRAVR